MANPTGMRRLVALASSLLLLVGVPAHAADSAPAPTVAVSVTVNGLAVTKATTKATWVVTNAGQIAELDLDSENIPGMLTTVDAVWTSHGFKVYTGLPLLEYKGASTHTGLATSSLPAGFSYGFRTRVPGRAWTPWSDVLVGYEASTPSQVYESGKQYVGTALRAGKVQVQFRLHLELADLSKEAMKWWLIGYT